MVWGTATVLAKTTEILRALSKTYYLLKEQEDIDDLESLRRFHQQGLREDLAFSTSKILENLAY